MSSDKDGEEENISQSFCFTKPSNLLTKLCILGLQSFCSSSHDAFYLSFIFQMRVLLFVMTDDSDDVTK